MIRLSDEQIEQRYKNLPPQVKTIVKSSETDNTLYQIGKNQGLSHDDAIIFINLASMVMVKLISLDDAPAYISSALDIKRPLAQALVEDVRKNVINLYQSDYAALKVVGVQTQEPEPAPAPTSWRSFIESKSTNDDKKI